MVNQLIYLDKILLNLQKYSVNIYGAGGTGSFLIDRLAAMAYALRETTGREMQLTLYDFDLVSERNLGRSDFSYGDEGYSKTWISISKANLGYGLEWRHKNPHIDPPVSANFHFICTDNAKSRLEYIERIMTSFKGEEPDSRPYYIFDIGNDKDFGQIVMIDTARKLQDIDRTKISSETVGTESCTTRPLFAEQGLYINQFMALLTAQMFWTFLTEYNLDYSQIYVNLPMMRIVTQLKLTP